MKRPVVITSMLFVNNKEKILLLLRDTIPTIPFPDCWDLPGGHAEAGETPEETIVREIREEVGMEIESPKLFKASEFKDKIRHTFWQKADFDIKEIKLTEGQKLQWFSEEKIKSISDIKMPLGVKQIILDFFEKKLGKDYNT